MALSLEKIEKNSEFAQTTKASKKYHKFLKRARHKKIRLSVKKAILIKDTTIIIPDAKHSGYEW